MLPHRPRSPRLYSSTPKTPSPNPWRAWLARVFDRFPFARPKESRTFDDSLRFYSLVEEAAHIHAYSDCQATLNPN